MARSFAALQGFTYLAARYLALRAARPEIPAWAVHAWLTCDDPGLGARPRLEMLWMNESAVTRQRQMGLF